MNDLSRDYNFLKEEIDKATDRVLNSGRFIGGPEVLGFENNWSNYLGDGHVVSCANGTDALQLAFMALGLEPGDEIIMPSFGYVSAAETAVMMGLCPVLVDVNEDAIIDESLINSALSNRTKVILPIHLYGLSANMTSIMEIAEKSGVLVIEDSAQASGALTNIAGMNRYAGTIGTIGTFSHFPTKNLSCYGDGGSIYTRDEVLAQKLKLLRSHGQKKKYVHDLIGLNSRLDALQAAILNVKLKYIDQFNSARRNVASRYIQRLSEHPDILLPTMTDDHIFHQFTIRLPAQQRDVLKKSLEEKGIQTIVYYPMAISEQKALQDSITIHSDEVARELTKTVLSLPMHPHLTVEETDFICSCIFEAL